MQNLLIICETANFKNFTRRATTEAIKSRFPNAYALSNLPVRNMLNKKLESDVFENIPYMVSFKLPIIKKNFKFGIGQILQFDNINDTIVLTSPNQHFVLDIIKNKPRIAVVLSDPYHLMGYKFEDTNKILSAADFIFATSKRLTNQYIDLYFSNIQAKRVYWPNTVDTNIWDIAKFNNQNSKSTSQTTVGFAGNIMEVTDLKLLDHITSVCCNMNFEIAGKVRVASQKDLKHFDKIISKINVDYLDYIPFERLPQKIYEWDIGISIDKKNELSSYHHHNKIYQYLALGKPVVAYRNHEDYEYLNDVVFLANDYIEFVEMLKEASEYTNNTKFINKAVTHALNNNAEKRAQQFLRELSNEA